MMVNKNKNSKITLQQSKWIQRDEYEIRIDEIEEAWDMRKCLQILTLAHL